jgi:hypothetical protein
MMHQDTPIEVSVALLPPHNAQTLLDEPCHAEYLSSVCDSRSQTVAEFTQYLVEQACPEAWILPICRRAARDNGAVKLLYGSGYETTVLIGDAGDGIPTTSSLAVGVAVNQLSATPRQIGNIWMCPSDIMWTHASFHAQRNRNVCVYIRTGDKNFIVPA